MLAYEIPMLKVGDVVNKDGEIIRTIEIVDTRKIYLKGASLEAVEQCIAGLRQKLPSFTHRKAGLFPSYRNTDKIKRDLKRFDTDCRTIKEAGYFHYYQNEKSKGFSDTLIYKRGAAQLRVTDRQFRAVANRDKIKPGKSVDTRSTEEIMGLLEEAGRLDKKVPDAGEIARNIMDRFEKSVGNIRNKEVRDEYDEAGRRSLINLLDPFISDSTIIRAPAR